MQIALINGNKVTRIGDYRELFPNTSFTANGPDDAFLAENKAKRVSVFIPHTRETEKLVACHPYVDGDFVYTVKVEPLTEAELDANAAAEAAAAPLRCNYQAFWDALLISPVYQTIRSQSIQSLEVNTCCTEFIAAMTDAKAGRPNKDAIQACIWLLLAALTLTEEEVAGLQELMTVGGMDTVYVLLPE